MVVRVESNGVRVELGSGRVVFGGESLVRLGLDSSSLKSVEIALVEHATLTSDMFVFSAYNLVLSS